MTSYALWWFLQPSHLLLFFAAAGLLLRRRRIGRLLIAGSLLGLLTVGFTPLAHRLIAPLEERFPVPTATAPPPYGLIVLAGGEEPVRTAHRGSPQFNASGDRLTTFAWLAAAHPQAKLVYSGRGGAGAAATPAQTAATLLTPLLPGRPVLYEDVSSDTFEAAVEIADLLAPGERERVWWLVTSAFHMPRAIASFRAEGFSNIVAWPTDYTRPGNGALRLPDPVDNLFILDWAAHEWLGLAYYRLLGRTRELFPAPSSGSTGRQPHQREPAA